MLCACIHRQLALACAWDKEIFCQNVKTKISTLLYRQLFSYSWYMVCAGIQTKLALACARNKEIFHQNIKTKISTL